MQSSNIFTLQTPSGAKLTVQRYRFGQLQKGPKISFVAGVRGDAPEGMRVAFRLMRSLATFEDSLLGTVDIYPCINPLAAEQGQRLWPGFQIDQNRQFPGSPDGHPPARLAHALLQSLQGSDLVVELRGARPGFVELPQAMIGEEQGDSMVSDSISLLDVARQCNTSVVWKRGAGSKAHKTLGHQFRNTIVLDGGQGNRLTKEVGEIFADGCLYLLTRTTVLPEELLPFPWMAMEDPVVLSDQDVLRIRVNTAGLFLPSVNLGEIVESEGELGVVMDPRTSTVVETVVTSQSGRIMALRNQPVVSQGELVARIQVLEGV